MTKPAVWCVLTTGDDMIVSRVRGKDTCLVTNDEDVVPRLVELAQEISTASRTPLKLVRFTAREDLQDIGP